MTDYEMAHNAGLYNYEELQYCDLSYSYEQDQKIALPEFDGERFMDMYNRCGNSRQKIYARNSIGQIYTSLNDEFASKTYKPDTFTRFISTYPQPREIYAPAFRDRILHHHLVDFLMPHINKRLYAHSYANRINMGTHKGVQAAQTMMRQVGQGSYMQCDVSSYFTSIDKNILFKIVNFHIEKINLKDNDKDFISYLFKQIIFTNPETNHIRTGNFSQESKIRADKKLGSKGKQTGLPIGSYSSQFASMLYLNELDYYIKNKMKIKRYIRYVDDFIIFDKTSKDFKLQREEINAFLQEELKLTLNPKKTKIQPFHKGLDFLGYVIHPHYIKIRKRNIVNLKKKLKYANLWLECKYNEARKITLPDTTDMWKISPRNYNELLVFKFYMLQVLNSYYGNYKVANSYNLRREIYLNDFKILKEFYTPINSFSKFIIKPNLLGRSA